MINFKSTIFISLIFHSVVLAGSLFYYGKGNGNKKGFEPTCIPISIVMETKPSPSLPLLSKAENRKVSSPQTGKTISAKNHYLKKNLDKERDGAQSSNLESGNSGDCKPFIDNLYPAYPEEARQHGWEVKFLAYLKINGSGNVEAIRFSHNSIPTCFIQATEKALKAWHFYRKKNNMVEISVPIEFVLSPE